MRQSELFAKTLKESAKDEISINARLLVRAGFIRKLMAGVYSYLPLGLISLKKIEQVIRQEINKINGREILMPALHPEDLWQKTGRWQYPEMFKLKNRSDKNFSLGWTHEEIVTPLMKNFIKSYKDLPVAVYQIQDKFRDELRAKAGLLRGIEFLMKDLYSFHQDEASLKKYYNRVIKSYFSIFRRCGIKNQTFLTLARGGAFSKYSHEFQTRAAGGEDMVYFCPTCDRAVNKELIKEMKNQCPDCRQNKLVAYKTIEVGNIFQLGDRFARAFDFKFKDRDDQEKYPLMGCYGIGLSRLMGAIVEVNHDKHGLIWPEEIAPFRIHLLCLSRNKKIAKKAEIIYKDLKNKSVEVLYDDREKSAGEKLVEADLIGLPFRAVLSEKTWASQCLEVKKRKSQRGKLIKITAAEKI